MEPTSERPREQGYTLVELTVTMTLALLVTGLVYTVYLQAMKAVRAWEAGLDLENATHTTMRRLSDDLRETTGIERRGDTWVLYRTESSPVEYRIERDVLLRGDRPTHPRSLRTETFSLAVEGEGGALALPPGGWVRWPPNATRVRVRFALRGGRRLLDVHTTLGIRRATTWLPMAPTVP